MERHVCIKLAVIQANDKLSLGAQDAGGRRNAGENCRNRRRVLASAPSLAYLMAPSKGRKHRQVMYYPTAQSPPSQTLETLVHAARPFDDGGS